MVLNRLWSQRREKSWLSMTVPKNRVRKASILKWFLEKITVLEWYHSKTIFIENHQKMYFLKKVKNFKMIFSKTVLECIQSKMIFQITVLECIF